MPNKTQVGTDVGLPAKFKRLAWSNLAAQSAEQIGLAATPIVAVLALGAQEGATGALQTAQTLPFLLASIPAGVLVDRMSRARLMASAETLRVVSLLAVLALMMLGALTLPLLAALGFIGACGTVVYGVAAPALVPSLVERDALPAANGRIELARTTAYAGGPALGGALVGWIGGAPAFAVAAVLSAVAVVLLAGLAEPARPRTSPAHPWSDVREGVAFVLQHRLLRPILITQFIFNAALFVIQAVYVPYAIHRLQLSATGVGLTLAAFGIGMVVGALSAARIMGRLPLGAVIAIGPVSGFIAALVMVLTIFVPSALARRRELLSHGRRPDRMGGEHHHVAPDRHAGSSARTRLGHQQSGLRRPADRRRIGRLDRRTIRGRGLPDRRGRGLSGADRGDRALAGHPARGGAHIPHDLRRAIGAEVDPHSVKRWPCAATAKRRAE